MDKNLLDLCYFALRGFIWSPVGNFSGRSVGNSAPRTLGTGSSSAASMNENSNVRLSCILLLCIFLLPHVVGASAAGQRRNQNVKLQYTAEAIKRRDHRMLDQMLHKNPSLVHESVGGLSLVELAVRHGNHAAAAKLRRASMPKKSSPHAPTFRLREDVPGAQRLKESPEVC